MNTIQLIGRLTDHPKLEETKTGKHVCKLRLAVQRRGGKDAGAIFVDVVAWNKLAEITDKHLEKGRRVSVTGRLEHDVWKNDKDQTRQRHYIVADDIAFLDPRKNGVEVEADQPEAEPAAA